MILQNLCQYYSSDGDTFALVTAKLQEPAEPQSVPVGRAGWEQLGWPSRSGKQLISWGFSSLA